MIRGAVLFSLFTIVAGCLDQLGPDVGAKQFNTCVDEDSDPATPISFERDIRQGIFNRPTIHCVKCHTPGGATPIGIMIGGLDLSTYDTLKHGGVHSATTIVIAGKPCESTIVQKISAAPPFGARMPKDGPPYLVAADAQIIVDWIAEGANDN